MDRVDCNTGSVINASRDFRPPKQARNCHTSLVTEGCIASVTAGQFRFPK